MSSGSMSICCTMTYEELPSLPIDAKGADDNQSKKSESGDVGRIIWGPCSARRKKKGSNIWRRKFFARLTKIERLDEVKPDRVSISPGIPSPLRSARTGVGKVLEWAVGYGLG